MMVKIEKNFLTIRYNVGIFMLPFIPYTDAIVSGRTLLQTKKYAGGGEADRRAKQKKKRNNIAIEQKQSAQLKRNKKENKMKQNKT